MSKTFVPTEEKSRFYCENCHHEVPFNAAVCPHCKKNFTSVKCPICGFSGHPDKFLNGCPQCGYLSTTSALGIRRGSNVSRETRQRSRHKKDLFIPLMVLFLVLFALGVVWYYLTRNS